MIKEKNAKASAAAAKKEPKKIEDVGILFSFISDFYNDFSN
jgi:hypothetical protein